MAFTTWSALKTGILDDLADGSALTKSYSIEGRSRSFHSLKEVQDFLQFCDMKILAESGERVNFVTFDRPD